VTAVTRLPVGSSARPAGRGWRLEDYSWDDRTGVGQLTHWRRPSGSSERERVSVEVEQPSCAEHEGWDRRPRETHEVALARYFENVRAQLRALYPPVASEFEPPADLPGEACSLEPGS
jgi:hypothetical protein